MSRCELDVRGPLSVSVIDLVRARFGDVRTRVGPGTTTVLVVDGVDAAGERALLTLLWDSGHDVVSMRSTR